SGAQPGGGRADRGPQRGPSGAQPGGGRADRGPQRGPSGAQPGGGRADGGGLSALIHLMSARRLQLFDEPSSPRDRTMRLATRLADGRELRLREFGTRQSTWAKILRSGDLDSDPAVAK